MYSMIIIPLVVAMITQVIKLTTDSIPNNLNWQQLMNNYGGMPSSHAALVASLALMVGLEQGFGSAVFAVSFILLVVVLRDAVGFRREIGKNAVLTNMIAKEIYPTNPEILLRERIGHTAKEAVAGVIVGCVLTLILYYLMMLA